MEELIFSEFSEFLTMKNQLIVGDKNWLLDTYRNADDETLTMALEGLNLMLKYDEPFFYLNDEYLEKLIYFISEIRIKCSNIHVPIINEIISNTNIVKSRTKDFKFIEGKKYMYIQQEMRDSLLDKDILITSFCYDAIVLNGLINNEMSDIKEKDFILASVNYLINVCPGIFKDKDIRETLDEELSYIKNAKVYRKIVRKYAKDTEKLLKKCDKEG